MSAGNGDNLVLGGGAQDVMRGDAGDDVLAGGGGNDAMYGGRGDDIALGGAGNDTLIGDKGDTLTGGAGRDVFIADYLTADQSGLVTITDYQPGNGTEPAERVIITYAASITPASGPVSFVQTGDNVEVRLADGTTALLLTKVQAANLSAAAFTLEPDTLAQAS